MMSRSYGALFASLSAAALLLAPNDSFARPGGTAAHGLAATPSGPMARAPIAPQRIDRVYGVTSFELG